MGNIRLNMYSTENVSNYEGRLLGLVTPEMFYEFINNQSTLSRLYTSGTVRCDDILYKGDINGLRLAVTLKKKNNENVCGRKILFSEPLDMISEASSGKLAIIGSEDTYYDIEEE